MPRFTPDEIESLALDALLACGASAANAAPVARATRRAEMDGIGTVGLGFLPVYLAHLVSSRVDGGAVPSVWRAAPGVVRVDGGNGLGHPAMEAGFPTLIEAARSEGAAVLAVNNSYSAGVLGHPAEDLADAGLVALGFTNGPANIAPWGGSRPLFGTNPMALAVPRRGCAPMVLDQSSTTVARVKLNAALAKGGPIPEGWANDPDGRPTTDPDAARSGSMAPAGGARGAGIALMVELFAAALTGANLSFEMEGYGVGNGPPMNIGQFFIAIDPERFGEGFADRAERVFSAMLAQPGVRLPGDRRLEARASAMREGVEVDAGLIEQIKSFGARK